MAQPIPVIARRLVAGLLLGLAGFANASPQRLYPADINALPASNPTLVAAYGSSAQQFGELRIPDGTGPFPVAVIIHGGCWTKGFAALRNTAPIASALAARGIATWNIEYRQLGEPGAGWPGTFLDWGSATDHLRVLAKSYPLDLSRVVVIGHSAGAHAALWVAARSRLAGSSSIRGRNPLEISGAVAIDGPGELETFVGQDLLICKAPVIASLLGGVQAEFPDRYREASPFSLLPLGVPQYLISSSRVLRPQDAARYVQRAAEAGDEADLLVLAASDHFEPIAPGRSEWKMVEALIVDRAFRIRSGIAEMTESLGTGDGSVRRD